MKKLLLVLAIGAFVACNNNTESGEVKPDTTAAPAPVAPVDTTATPVDTTAKPVDTSAVKK